MARRKDHTRKELESLILSASCALMEKGGFGKVTARAIADKIGYTPGTIYNVFKSMDDIALHINAQTLDALHEKMSTLATRKSTLESMKAMAAAYMDFARAHRPYWLMLFAHAADPKRKMPKWYQDKVDKLFEPLENLLASDIKNAKKRQAMARTLWSSVHGICYLQESGKIPIVAGATTATTMANDLIENYMRGVDGGC